MRSGRPAISLGRGFRSRLGHLASAFVLSVAALSLSVATAPQASADTAAQISAGGEHTCALTTGGGVKCWGCNIDGQLGNGTTTDSPIPVDVSGLTSGVAAISAGAEHTCALTSGGGAKCWGDNGSGQLGDGTTTIKLDPGRCLGPHLGRRGDLGRRNHTCALTTGGGVKCWGYNYYGELGNGTTTDTGCICIQIPVDVSGLTSGVAVISATSPVHTCAITTGRGAKCWGDNSHGQLGNGATTVSSTPVDVSGLTSGVAAISTGYFDTCAVTTGGGAKCWGRNRYGQLGNGTSTDSLTPVDVLGLTSGIGAISAGEFHTCALTTGGGAKCWGHNDDGELGNGTTSGTPCYCIQTPVDVSGLTSGVAAISVGFFHNCALTTGGDVNCWGYNLNGQLGNGTTTDSSTPVDVVGFGGATSGPYRPDALIKKAGATAFTGNDVYSQTATGETVSADAARGTISKFVVAAQNDGTQTDSFTLRGCSNWPRFSIHYFSGTTDITLQVKAGTYLVGPLAPGAKSTITLAIKARFNATVGSVKRCTVGVRSLGDTTLLDAVRAQVNVTS